jgi:ribosomal protein S1
MDQENERFSSGAKQLEEDPFQKIMKHRLGQPCRCKVTAVESKWCQPDMGGEVMALSSIKNSTGNLLRWETIEAQVTNIDDKEHRIVLEHPSYHKSGEAGLEDSGQQGDATSTLSDVLSKDNPAFSLLTMAQNP